MPPTPHRLWFVWLYFLEGAPIGWVWWVLPVQLTKAGVPIDEVTGLTALLTLPWAFKFLWAPVVDRTIHRTGYRPWIWGGLGGMGVCLLLGGTTLHWGWLLGYSFLAATQDVAIDGYAMATVPRSERGRLNGSMQLGMIAGRWLFGSGMLLASAWIPFGVQCSLLVGLIGSAALTLFFFPDYRPETQPPPMGAWLRQLPRQTFLLGAVGVALISGLGFEAMGAVAGPFLLGLGLSESSIGGFFSFSLLAMAAGALAGGWLADRRGHLTVFKGALIGIALLTLVLALADRIVSGPWLNYGLLLLSYAGMGVFMTSSYAFFMDLGHRTPYPATTFSALMGATNASESLAAYSIGRLVPQMGYGLGMGTMGLLSLLALFVFRFTATDRSGEAT